MAVGRDLEPNAKDAGMGDSGRQSFAAEMSNALQSTESPSWEQVEGSDPVINVGDANEVENDGSEQQGSDVAAQSDASQAAAAKAAEEWFEFNANGKKTRFNIADKEAIKKILPLAHGARQWQSERDSWKNKYSEVEKPFNDLKSNWDKLEGAYKQFGVEGVLDIIGGKPGYSKEYMEKTYQERLKYEQAPAHEQARIDHERMLAELNRERDSFKREAETRAAKLAEIESSREEAQVKADLTPHYNRYRFDGKLGDSEMEAEYNGIVWDKAVEALASISDSGTTLTSQVIASEFKKVHDRYARVLKVNQETAAAKAIENTKTSAKKSLASSVRSQTAESASPQIKTGKSSSASLSNTWAKLFNVK